MTDHPRDGHIHVLGYQNTAVNFSSGPNAMLLHLPGVGMSQRNFIDTSSCRNILKDQVDAVTPRTRGGGYGSLGVKSAVVHVFEHDIYTVVLTEDPTLIPSALLSVPAHKRPSISRDLVNFYTTRFPGWSIALCCFDNREAKQAAPLLMWYTPLESEPGLRLPALDCHTGEVPDVDALVDVDHWVIVSGPDLRMGAPVHYSDRISPDQRLYLPTEVIGRSFRGRIPNGDFVISRIALREGYIGVESVSRPNAPSSRSN
ncbi:MAG: hypothetical protein HZC02_00425 [Candidatus Levybacteria bacterium]|nr:hypothetical protein [Candidatus Levybacteria bacterium]